MRARRAAVLAVVLLVVGAASLIGAGPAYAGFSEHIADYRSDVTIETDGTIEVHETIVYDFGVVPKHGIYRTIPVRTDQSGKDGYDRVYPLTVVSVSGSADTPAQYTVEDDGDNQRIKIGDPDRTISGEHTYDIVYRVRGAMNAFADHDELVWNAVGVEWPVPIDKASAVVHAPADITQFLCTSGSLGSFLPCDSASSNGPTAEFSKASLNPYEGMTFTVALPKGVIVPSPKPILEERFSFTSAFRVTPATGGISGGLLAVLALLVIFLVCKFGRDRRYAGSAVDAAYGPASGDGADGGPEVSAPLREGETPVEFVPPDGLRPGELGTLIDFDAGTLDVTATIIDLAVRGYLKIEEVDKEWYQFKHDWKLTKLPKEDPLKQYERSLYSGLFKDGDEVKLSDLKNTFAERMSKVRAQLMDDAMSQKWFTRKPGTVKVLWGLLGIVVFDRRCRAHDPPGGSNARRAARRARDHRRDPAAGRGRGGCRSAPPRATRCCGTRSGSNGSSTSRRSTGRSSPSAPTSSPSTCRTRSCSARRRSGRRRSRVSPTRSTRRRGTCRSTRSTTRCSRVRSTASR